MQNLRKSLNSEETAHNLPLRASQESYVIPIVSILQNIYNGTALYMRNTHVL